MSEKREERLVIQVTKNEKKKIKSFAKKLGYQSVSSYVRKISQNGTIITMDTSFFNESFRHISGVGKNINQIAKHCNIEQKIELDNLVKIQEMLEQIFQLLKKQREDINKIKKYIS